MRYKTTFLLRDVLKGTFTPFLWDNEPQEIGIPSGISCQEKEKAEAWCWPEEELVFQRKEMSHSSQDKQEPRQWWWAGPQLDLLSLGIPRAFYLDPNLTPGPNMDSARWWGRDGNPETCLFLFPTWLHSRNHFVLFKRYYTIPEHWWLVYGDDG